MPSRKEVVPPSGTEACGVVPGLVGVGLNGWRPAGVLGPVLLTGAGSYPPILAGGALKKPPERSLREVNTGEIEDKSVGTPEVGFVSA